VSGVVSVDKPYRLLIVDDDPGFRETLKLIFGERFFLLEAACGEEAIEIGERERFDIALVDMHMRVLTGLETVRVLKQIRAQAPRILITADATEELRQDASPDVYDVLSKPVTRVQLVSTVSTALVAAYHDAASVWEPEA
jgi:CheY-like chemotaxis protein